MGPFFGRLSVAVAAAGLLLSAGVAGTTEQQARPRPDVPSGALGESSGAVAASVPPAALPLDITDAKIRPLRETLNERLQQALERQIAQDPTWARLVTQERLAVGLVDLRDPQAVRFARINGNVMMYAASLPKIAILLASAQAMEDGRLPETPENLAQLRTMISRSSNASAAALYELLGFEYIEGLLMDPRYRLYDPVDDGGLWVGKPYGRDGEYHPDPVEGLVHGATATQVCRFYYMLAYGRLVNRERSRQMLAALVDPQIDHKFVHTLERLAPAATIYRKSGTWRQWHSDSALVWGPTWRRYIFVALVEDPAGETILRSLIEAAEDALLDR